jgi:hypothetical protein
MFALDPRPPASQLTHHALLIAWGHFAQTLALPAQFANLPVPQKTVQHTPAHKLLTVLLGILAGNEYLRDLSYGPAPLSRDPAVAAAWDLPGFAEASSISRTLQCANATTLAALQQILDRLTTPFLAQALAALRRAATPLQLDVDLTGQPVSATSQTYPAAAFGYMDGAICLGYQLAEVCLHTPQWGRLWLAGQHHPGDTVSSQCLLDLVAAAEARLGCHPRRRVELLQERIAAHQALLARQDADEAARTTAQQAAHQRQAALHTALQQARRRVLRLTDYPVSPTQAGPGGALTQAQRRVRGLERQAAQTRTLLEQLQQEARRGWQIRRATQAALAPLLARHAQLSAENAAQPDAPQVRLRMDAGFCNGEMLTAVLELGYEVETKAAHPSMVRALLARVTPDMAWTRVGQNAQMLGWTNYQMQTCPYALTVGLERFYTPQGLKHSVLVRSQDSPTAPLPDLASWFASYNARQVIEAGIKQEKMVFKVQHLWSRSAVGIQIQIALTLFAANFVAWGNVWLQERVITPQTTMAQALQRPKYLVRVAANSLATIEQQETQTVIRFSPLSSLAGTLIHLSGPAPVQLAFNLMNDVHLIDAKPG